MKFYARLSPGVSTSLDSPLTIVMHMPRKASGVVVKVWELCYYVDIDGEVVKEEGTNDLLVELHGDVEHDPELRKQGRSKFVVANVIHPTHDAKTKLSALRLKVEGSDTIYDALIPSTDAEFAGQNFEIGLTVEHCGSEVFRSWVPSFIRPQLAAPRVKGKRIIDYTAPKPVIAEDEYVDLAGHYATFGHATAETDDGNLLVTGFAWIDESGHMQPCDGEGNPLPDELLVVRHHKHLFVYISRDLPKVAKQIGDTSISLRLCHRVKEDGSIELMRPFTNHPFAFSTSDGAE
jgi:hypothetical protein